jgi:hypothetical protein
VTSHTLKINVGKLNFETCILLAYIEHDLNLVDTFGVVVLSMFIVAAVITFLTPLCSGLPLAMLEMGNALLWSCFLLSRQFLSSTFI